MITLIIFLFIVLRATKSVWTMRSRTRATLPTSSRSTPRRYASYTIGINMLKIIILINTFFLQWSLLIEPESLNICFWYIPEKARSLPHGKERDELLDQATLQIRRSLQVAGKCLVNYSDLPGVHGHFFRMISCNPNSTKGDMDFVINHIEELGKQLTL